jgi:hypothetical protein
MGYPNPKGKMCTKRLVGCNEGTQLVFAVRGVKVFVYSVYYVYVCLLIVFWVRDSAVCEHASTRCHNRVGGSVGGLNDLVCLPKCVTKTHAIRD